MLLALPSWPPSSAFAFFLRVEFVFVCRLAEEPHYGRMSGGGTLSHRESFNAARWHPDLAIWSGILSPLCGSKANISHFHCACWPLASESDRVERPQWAGRVLLLMLVSLPFEINVRFQLVEALADTRLLSFDFPHVSDDGLRVTSFEWKNC